MTPFVSTARKSLRRSEIRRKLGIRLRRKFALIRCRKRRCRSFLIVKNGQLTKLCVYCGHRFWLAGIMVRFQSDSLDLLRKLMTGTGNYYHPFGFISADRLLRTKAGAFVGQSTDGG